ncbi:MAG: IS1182 family transposase [Spirochaetales bacterium]|jgi:transposase|nr:IS1182 family transposase [Spirochaetales bacterium]
MGKFKDHSYDQKVFIPVSFSDQVLPGTFEYTLNHVVDNELDLSVFHDRFKNDENGAPAYDPAILLKIILYAYSRGIVSSREIARLCRENVVCMALSADSHPHFTTIANFISTMDKEIAPLITQILSVCYANHVIGGNMFAIDGCKITSNCSKEWSGTKGELFKKAKKIDESIRYLLTKHREADKNTYNESQEEKEKASIEKLKAKSQKIREWLSENDEKLGVQGKPIKSNITDNESAKMSSSHGVIQGYNGIAAVDEKHQLIVWAEAFGDSTESQHFPDILAGIKTNFSDIGASDDIFDEAVVTADSGFHSNKNMQLILENDITAFVADNQFRKRDVRFDSAQEHKKKRVENWKPVKGKKYFSADEFTYDERCGRLICPAGFAMRVKCRNLQSSGYTGVAYIGERKNCRSCSLRSRCIRKATTAARQVMKLDGVCGDWKISYTEQMKRIFDKPESRSIYSKRMGTVEPVFGNIRSTLGLDRFTLRSKKKVNVQWLLFCMVHNIGKIQKYSKA